MGPLPQIDHARPLAIEILSSSTQGQYTKTKLTYQPEPGRKVTAWLLLPKSCDAAKCPAALALHQTTRIGKDEPAGDGPNPNLYYGKELAERGWIVLMPDYPSFGDDHTDFDRDVYARGYQSGTMFGIVNHIRAVDLLAAHPHVDPAKIVVIGHSLGGHNALFLAAFDTRIRAAVTSCGFTSFAKYYGGDLKGWTSPRYMPLIATKYANSPHQVPFDFTDVLTAIAPRAIFINAPTRDANFDSTGVDDVVNTVKPLFPPGRLIVRHPDSTHDFPEPVRKEAYDYLEKLIR